MTAAYVREQARPIFGDAVECHETGQHFELRVKGKLKYAAYSEKGNGYELVRCLVEAACERKAMQGRSCLRVDPVEVARALLANRSWSPQGRDAMQREPVVEAARPLQYRRAIPAGAGAAEVTVSVTPNLTVQVSDGSGQEIAQGMVVEVQTVRATGCEDRPELGVEWCSGASPAAPASALAAIGADVQGMLSAFRAGQVEVERWTADPRARTLLGEWVSVSPLPVEENHGQEEEFPLVLPAGWVVAETDGGDTDATD